MAIGKPINHRNPDGTEKGTLIPVPEAIQMAKMYTGVDYYPKVLGFVVQFRMNGNREYFGPFLTAKDAGDAYDKLHEMAGNNKKPSYKGPVEEEEWDF